MQDTDVAILGAGAAGLSFAYWLCVTSPQNAPSSLTLIEAPPGPARPAERTWCFWEGPDGAYDTALTAQWRSLRVRGGRDGGSVTGCPSPLRYKMLRSTDFKALVEARLEKSPGVRRVEATVREVHDVPGGALVQGSTAQGGPLNLRARWVFDSRPLPRLPPSRTTWLQHFRGWFLRSARPVFDPRTADLMDFRTAQPADGLSFGYVLPTSPYEALVEYTEFSPAVLDDNGYGQALRQYVGDVLGLDEYEVTGVEQGVIPMTDARFPRRAGRSVFRIGTADAAPVTPGPRPSLWLSTLTHRPFLQSFSNTRLTATYFKSTLAQGEWDLAGSRRAPMGLFLNPVTLSALGSSGTSFSSMDASAGAKN